MISQVDSRDCGGMAEVRWQLEDIISREKTFVFPVFRREKVLRTPEQESCRSVYHSNDFVISFSLRRRVPSRHFDT